MRIIARCLLRHRRRTCLLRHVQNSLALHATAQYDCAQVPRQCSSWAFSSTPGPAARRGACRGACAVPVDAGAAALCARGSAALPTCAAWSLQVLQACVVRLVSIIWSAPGGLKRAFLLPTVCRCAPQLLTLESSHADAAAGAWDPLQRDRRFKEALEQPFWSTLDGNLAARLWRVLGRPGAPLCRLVLSQTIQLCSGAHEPLCSS